MNFIITHYHYKIGLSGFYQDNSKSYRWILTNVFGGVGLGTDNNCIDFKRNLDLDPVEEYFKVLLSFRFLVLVGFSGINHYKWSVTIFLTGMSS